MPAKTISVALDLVSATQQQPLGQTFERFHPTLGQQVWIYVFNDEASSPLVVGSVCAHDASTPTPGDVILAPADAPAMRVVGVAQWTIPAGYYGFILRSGIGEVEADTAGITANTPLTVGAATAGHSQDGSATEMCYAFAHEAAAEGALATCTVDCRG